MEKPPRVLSVALLYFLLERIPRTQTHDAMLANHGQPLDVGSQGPVTRDVEVIGHTYDNLETAMQLILQLVTSHIGI